MRITKSSSLLPAIQRGQLVKIIVDGRPIDAYEGETVAAAMLAAGIYTFRQSRKYKEPRSLSCGMGSCMECIVTVDGANSLRACMTPVADGMLIETCEDI
jgi:predicted molibdopterin-dependent oxidoreductase YjgC